MKALVLSGGKGTRLRPITHTMAKQLVPVANRPILHYCLDNILNAGITDIGVVISPETGTDVIKSVKEWQENKPVEITVINQEKPLGLAHAVKISQDYLQDDSFVMYLGDNLIKYDVKALVDEFKSGKNSSYVLLKEVENPNMFGVANISDGKIIKLEEKPQKPKSNLALVGVYLFTKDIHEGVNNIIPSKRGELEITEAIQYLIDHSYPVNYHVLDGWWLDTGKKDDLLSANRVVLDEFTVRSKLGEICSKTKIEGRVEIGEGTKITNSKIIGPVIIGKNCTISDAYIGPFTSISDNVAIETSSVEYSVIMKNSRIIKIKGRIIESLIGSEVVVESSKELPAAHRFLAGDHSHIILAEA